MIPHNLIRMFSQFIYFLYQQLKLEFSGNYKFEINVVSTLANIQIFDSKLVSPLSIKFQDICVLLIDLVFLFCYHTLFLFIQMKHCRNQNQN